MADSLPTVIMQTLTDACPDMDWAAGSVARELVAVPAAMLGATFDKYIQDAERIFNIKAILADPEQYKEQIDQWIEWLGLDITQDMQATGKVKIYLEDISGALVIMEGTQFSAADAFLQSTSTTSWVKPEDITTEYSSAIAYPDGTYSVEIDVLAAAPSTIAIEAGTAVEWLSAPATVTGVFVSSAINGGKAEMTYNEKAALVYDTLQQHTMTSSDGLQALVRTQYPYLVNSLCTGRRTGESTTTATVYAKPVKSPQSINRTIFPDSVNGTVYTFSGCGIYAITQVICNNRVVTDYTVTYKNTVGASDSIICLTTTEPMGELTVVCTGFEQFPEIHAVLNNQQALSLYKFRLCMPAIAYISVALHTEDELTALAQTAIQDYINTLPMTTTLISDTNISKVLADYGITLTAPSFYTATVVHGSHQHVTTAIGSISVAQLMSDSSAPTACYTFFNNIGVF